MTVLDSWLVHYFCPDRDTSTTTGCASAITHNRLPCLPSLNHMDRTPGCYKITSHTSAHIRHQVHYKLIRALIDTIILMASVNNFSGCVGDAHAVCVPKTYQFALVLSTILEARVSRKLCKLKLMLDDDL